MGAGKLLLILSPASVPGLAAPASFPPICDLLRLLRAAPRWWRHRQAAEHSENKDLVAGWKGLWDVEGLAWVLAGDAPGGLCLGSLLNIQRRKGGSRRRAQHGQG